MPALVSMASTGLFELRICSQSAPLLDPRSLVPPKWTGQLRAMALATASQACMCPHLGCLATLCHIRAHPLVAVPQVFVSLFAVTPRALACPLVATSRLYAQPCLVPRGSTP